VYELKSQLIIILSIFDRKSEGFDFGTTLFNKELEITS